MLLWSRLFGCLVLRLLNIWCHGILLDRSLVCISESTFLHWASFIILIPACIQRLLVLNVRTCSSLSGCDSCRISGLYLLIHLLRERQYLLIFIRYILGHVDLTPRFADPVWSCKPIHIVLGSVKFVVFLLGQVLEDYALLIEVLWNSDHALIE